jgi:hypothetical protein
MPTIKLTVEITDGEAAQLDKWRAQGLIDSDDEMLDSLVMIRNNNKPTQTRNSKLKQRAILLIGIPLTVLMVLFPPYRCRHTMPRDMGGLSIWDGG